ncbi:MAG: carbon-nitrogen hydrolase family protein [Deltaproteobacteria bacterium]|nr:carbon-nitrogen hydrolase family protein [Deltaproteobacteria bacterium]
MRTVVIGAIQMESRNGDVEGNLARALPLLEQAVERGAELVCLPEFLPSGYLFHERAWDAAEPSQGATAQWLVEQAKRLGVIVGTSFLEATSQGFKNVFVLTGPEGELGRVYKQDVALFENYFMEGEKGSHVIETPLGKIGVGICYENLRAFLSRLLVEHDVDLVLQPHSCPGAPSWFPRWGRRMFEEEVRGIAQRYAKGLGIPAVFVNKCGPFVSPLPMFPYRLDSPYVGATAIVDCDGAVLERAEPRPAVLVATVQLDPARKTHRPLPARGRWVAQGPWIALRAMEWVDRRGRAAYRRNQRKVAAARRMGG